VTKHRQLRSFAAQLQCSAWRRCQVALFRPLLVARVNGDVGGCVAAHQRRQGVSAR
jgi:hypothetical protein